MKSFTETAPTLGVSWFNIYLAESLASGFQAEDSVLAENFRWLLLHLAQQASSGNMRTDLRMLEPEMAEWFLQSDNGPEADIDKGLPSELASNLEKILAEAEVSGLLGRLPAGDAPADSLPVPRPALVLSFDGRYLYFLKRRRAEDRFLSYLGNRTVASKGVSFSLPVSNPDDSSGALMHRLSEGKKFLILSGGPGTGKTTTISRLLSLMDAGSEEAGLSPARVALAAPTGRAAARLGEALGSSTERAGRTLHSLLGLSPYHRPRFCEDDPLPADLVIVDEASMVDLPMMNLLLDALGPSTALLLVGDPDQLPSVEAGAILGDLLSGASSVSAGVGPLDGCIENLTTVYRSSTAILEAAAAVREGDKSGLADQYRDNGVRLQNLASPEKTAIMLAESYRKLVDTGRLLSEPDDGLFLSCNAHAVLSPLRKGPWGVRAMNNRISIILGGRVSAFAGMPVMVTGNDRSRGLWNGDRGILLEKDDYLRAFFPGKDSYRQFPLAALPGWEPAWVQTIHKSQGSEFDRVTILLPRGAERLLSREILYTALTRARQQVCLYADAGTVESALDRRVRRNSRILDWAAGS